MSCSTSDGTTTYISCPNKNVDKEKQENDGKMMRHDVLRLFVIGLSVLMFVCMLVLSTIAGHSTDIGIFDETISEVSAKYDTNITPARQTFAIWGVIFTWQVLWLLYGVIQTCRTHVRNYLYVFPPTMPTGMYLSFIFNNVCIIIWLFMWTKEMLIVSLVFLILATASLFVALYFSFSTLYKFLGLLYKEELNTDIWLIRILVENGLAFYATWISIASILNFTIVLINNVNIDTNLAGTISLALAALGILLWFMLDSIILDKYVRYTFSPYIVLTIAFTGITVRNFNMSLYPRNSILTGVLLGLSCITLLCKIVTMIWLHNHQPIIIKAPMYRQPTNGNSRH